MGVSELIIAKCRDLTRLPMQHGDERQLIL